MWTFSGAISYILYIFAKHDHIAILSEQIMTSGGGDYNKILKKNGLWQHKKVYFLSCVVLCLIKPLMKLTVPDYEQFTHMV